MNKLLPLLLLLAFSGCKKDDNTTDLLTQSWQTTAITVKIADGSTISRDISSCDNNRIYTFRKDGSFLMSLPLVVVFQAALPKLIMAPGV
jgi:hypothetical protein